MSSPRSITAVITTLDYGGAETQLVNVMKRLRSRGWRVEVVSLVSPRAFAGELRQHSIEVRSLDMRQGVADPRAVGRLLRYLRAFRPDVVHSHMFHANLLSRLVRPMVGKAAFVSTIHSAGEPGRARDLLYRLTDGLTDVTTSVSEAAGRKYVEAGAVPATRIRVIPNGVDTDHFRPDHRDRKAARMSLGLDGRFVWLSVGRYIDSKDHPTLLEAFAAIVARRSDAVLVLVGQGPGRSQAEAIVDRLGIRDAVIFLGVRDDVPSLMRSADGYVMSSWWEGLPVVLLEASASGLPVVATCVGGNIEVVLDEETGKLVPPRKPLELADGMLGIMDRTPAERASMGGRGRDLVISRYGLDAVTSSWEALYGELVEARVRASAPLHS